MDIENKLSHEINHFSLREERRRTGRYVAVALAICITLLGLYQAIIQHTPVIAGLFAPAIIMFLYVFWVLYTASKAQRRQQLALAEDEENEEGELDNDNGRSRGTADTHLTEITVNPIANDTAPILPKDVNLLAAVKEDNILIEKIARNKLNRTYSIA